MDEDKNNIKNYNGPLPQPLMPSEVGRDNAYLSIPWTDSARMQNCFPKKAVQGMGEPKGLSIGGFVQQQTDICKIFYYSYKNQEGSFNTKL